MFTKGGAIITGQSDDRTYFGASWQLTRELSPRSTVRVDGADAYGQRTNTYAGTAPITGDEPASPWAMYLAADGHFRYLCLDLDAKTPAATKLVAEHADAIATVLDDHGIAHVLCDSGGPYSGRHIWIALTEPLPAETARQLGVLARAQWPTLDTAPISNAGYGCVRPPGAPHRSGGHSTILLGDLDTLRRPTTTTHQVAALVSTLAALVDAHSTTQAQAAHGPLPIDDHGHVYLPGVRRSLSPAAAAALRDREAAQVDASATLFRVLLGAAAARWRYADVAALVDAQPGLEHVRTARDGSGRTRRPSHGAQSPARILRRQWDKAVRQIAGSGIQGTDPTFDARSGAIAALVRILQQRADATAGRWHRGGGPADRRVLDVLCVLALQAVSGRVEADIRRVALLAGIGRETARTALLRLAADGWIARTAFADGPHGARWSIDPAGVLHRDDESSRSQADPRPEGAGAAERSLQLTALIERTQAACHDLFTTGHTLGIRTGNLYARLTTEPQQLNELHTQTGSPAPWISHRLDLLQRLGLARRHSAGWTRTQLEARNRLAEQIGAAGRLDERRERYDVERELWAWWCAELTWMTTPRKKKPRNRPGPGQLSLIPDVGTNRRGAHPRRPDGKADYKLARAYLTATASDPNTPVPLKPLFVPVNTQPTAEDLITSVLGGRLIEVRPFSTALEALRTG